MNKIRTEMALVLNKFKNDKIKFYRAIVEIERIYAKRLGLVVSDDVDKSKRK